jgi:hypothetical protein
MYIWFAVALTIEALQQAPVTGPSDTAKKKTYIHVWTNTQHNMRVTLMVALFALLFLAVSVVVWPRQLVREDFKSKDQCVRLCMDQGTGSDICMRWCTIPKLRKGKRSRKAGV